MSNLINLIRDKASIEAIKADLYDNRHDKNYVNVVGRWGSTALIHACYNGNIGAVKLLLAEDADVNVVNEWSKTALRYACIKGNIGVVKLLLEANADVNVVDGWGSTPLEIAEEYGHTEIVELINNRNKTNNYIILNGKKYKRVEDKLEKLITRIHNLMKLDTVNQTFVIEIYNIYNVNYRFKHYDRQVERVKFLDSAMLSPIKEVALDIFCSAVNKYLDEIGG